MKSITMEEINGPGWATVVATWIAWGFQWLMQSGNNLIATLTGILALIFLFYKIKMIRIELREKKEEIKKRREKENEEIL